MKRCSSLPYIDKWVVWGSLKLANLRPIKPAAYGSRMISWLEDQENPYEWNRSGNLAPRIYIEGAQEEDDLM